MSGNDAPSEIPWSDSENFVPQSPQTDPLVMIEKLKSIQQNMEEIKLENIKKEVKSTERIIIAAINDKTATDAKNQTDELKSYISKTITQSQEAFKEKERLMKSIHEQELKVRSFQST